MLTLGGDLMRWSKHAAIATAWATRDAVVRNCDVVYFGSCRPCGNSIVVGSRADEGMGKSTLHNFYNIRGHNTRTCYGDNCAPSGLVFHPSELCRASTSAASISAASCIVSWPSMPSPTWSTTIHVASPKSKSALPRCRR